MRNVLKCPFRVDIRILTTFATKYFSGKGFNAMSAPKFLDVRKDHA